jgi:hypothetical protein
MLNPCGLMYFMVESDEAKGMANASSCTTDWQKYCNLRNHVTKLNKKKKKLHYQTKINYIKNTHGFCIVDMW